MFAKYLLYVLILVRQLITKNKDTAIIKEKPISARVKQLISSVCSLNRRPNNKSSFSIKIASKILLNKVQEEVLLFRIQKINIWPQTHIKILKLPNPLPVP